jgi:flagellar motor switch protein FliN/FliY
MERWLFRSLVRSPNGGGMADSQNTNVAEDLLKTTGAEVEAATNVTSIDGKPIDSGAPPPRAGKGDDRNLDLILDIPLKVTVELGCTKLVVSELLNLGQGSVIELNKLAGEPMEVLVNDKLVARGEAVVVNEKFGVRLTDIISPSERVEQLK